MKKSHSEVSEVSDYIEVYTKLEDGTEYHSIGVVHGSLLIEQTVLTNTANWQPNPYIDIEWIIKKFTQKEINEIPEYFL